jgi:hypothetical protein
MARSNGVVVADHVEPGRRDESGDPRAEVERFEDERDRAVAQRLLEHVAQPRRRSRELLAADLVLIAAGFVGTGEEPAQPRSRSSSSVERKAGVLGFPTQGHAA